MDDERVDIPGYDDGRLVFHYSREHRLDRASAAVRAINEARPAQRRGLLRALTSTKPLAFGFVSILTICAVMVLYSIFGRGRPVARIGGTEIRVEAAVTPEKTYITVRKKAKGGGSYSGVADFIVSASPENAGADESGIMAHSERLYFSLDDEETFRFIVPFSGKSFLVFAVLDEDRAMLRVGPGR